MYLYYIAYSEQSVTVELYLGHNRSKWELNRMHSIITVLVLDTR